MCREILRPWHAARHPYMPINGAAIKAECESPLFSFLGLAEATLRQSVQVGVQVRALALGKQFFTVPCPHTTGTARLPEASQSPLVLKQVVRKPLEAVLRYLGKLDGGT